MSGIDVVMDILKMLKAARPDSSCRPTPGIDRRDFTEIPYP